MGRVAFEVGHELAANFGMNGRSVKKVGYKFAISLGIYTQYHVKMEEKPLIISQTQNQKIASRRSRKDEEGRDYQCGCGKRYLSYPALYTHIKTKHDGKQPEGTLKTGTNIITKRAKVKLQDQTLKQIYTLFDQFTPEALLKIDESLKGNFPVGSRIKKDGVAKEVYDQYLAMTKQHEFRLTQNSSLDLALALFLLNIGELVNEKIYDQFLIFTRLARNCFHEHGQEIYRACFAKKDCGPFQVREFSLLQLKYFPLVSDFFVRFYLPGTDNKDTKEANPSLMEVIVYDFCTWLNSLKLTNIKVFLTRNVEIDFKPVAQAKPKATPGKAELPKQHYEKEIKQQNEEESDQLSENEEIDEQMQNEDKNPSGSKENEQVQ